MEFNLNDPEKQAQLLKRIPYYDEKAILDLFDQIKDDLITNEILDTFMVNLAIIIEAKIKTPIAELLIRQYSDKDRLPIRLSIYRIIK